MLPQGSGLGVLRNRLNAMALHFGHCSPVAGFKRLSSALMRFSSVSTCCG
jgi:hypothetical protein